MKIINTNNKKVEAVNNSNQSHNSMKQKLIFHGVEVEVEVNPPKLYGKNFTDWVKENYTGVLPALRITKKWDHISVWWSEGIVRSECWEINWRFKNNLNFGNSKTIRLRCHYNHDGSILNISWSHGIWERGTRSHIKTEKGFKISMRNIIKRYLDSPEYRGTPSWLKEKELETIKNKQNGKN